jgi:hypothetical protein
MNQGNLGRFEVHPQGQTLRPDSGSDALEPGSGAAAQIQDPVARLEKPVFFINGLQLVNRPRDKTFGLSLTSV